jgi:pSer/pThr/pTyr-binding forkhead associated (FHA) protein
MKSPPHITVQLVHIQGPLKGEIQEFSESVIVIGRSPSSHLCFPADLAIISRKHAEIIREGNRFKLIDHSINGTFVNGKRITEAYLKDGDVMMFAEGGPKVSFLTQIKEGRIAIDTSVPFSDPDRSQIFSVQEPLLPSAQKTPPTGLKTKESIKPSIKNVKVPLVIQYGPTLRSFNELPITIGKSPNCDFVLDHPAILDRQAQIFFSQDQYWVKDLTGQGLIQINQRPIPMEMSLKKDDNLALSPQGPFFRFLGEGRLAEIEKPSSKGLVGSY